MNALTSARCGRSFCVAQKDWFEAGVCRGSALHQVEYHRHLEETYFVNWDERTSKELMKY